MHPNGIQEKQQVMAKDIEVLKAEVLVIVDDLIKVVAPGKVANMQEICMRINTWGWEMAKYGHDLATGTIKEPQIPTDNGEETI